MYPSSAPLKVGYGVVAHEILVTAQRPNSSFPFFGIDFGVGTLGQDFVNNNSLEFINADAIKDETNPGAKSDIYRLEATLIQCSFKDVCPIIHIAGGLSVWWNIS